MMRLYVLGLTLIVGLSLLLPGCNGPADSKDPQRWWNAKVGGKDTSGVYVQVHDRNTGALSGKHKLAAGDQVRIIFDSSAKVGSKVNLCRASMIHFMVNNQLMSGTLDQSSQLILIDQNVDFPPSDPYDCKLREYIGTLTEARYVRQVDPVSGAVIAGSTYHLVPGMQFGFSDCYDRAVGSSFPITDPRLIWVQIGATGGGRTPCIIEGPMPVTVSVTGRLGW